MEPWTYLAVVRSTLPSPARLTRLNARENTSRAIPPKVGAAFLRAKSPWRIAQGPSGPQVLVETWNAGGVARNIYIASVEGDTGKSTIALGITALLARSVTKVGIFRPVARVSDGSDYVLRLLLGHDGVDLDYEECVGVTYEELHANHEAALSRIVTRYHEVARKCDVVVIVGTDYTDVAGPAEFELNAKVAANLGAPVALVVRGADRSPAEIADVLDQARATMEEHHAKVVAGVRQPVRPRAGRRHQDRPAGRHRHRRPSGGAAALRADARRAVATRSAAR